MKLYQLVNACSGGTIFIFSKENNREEIELLSIEYGEVLDTLGNYEKIKGRTISEFWIESGKNIFVIIEGE